MPDGESRAAFDVEPTAVEPPRRDRRPDPVVIGAVGIALAIVVAILKPWDAAEPMAPSPPPITAASPSSGPDPADPVADPATTARILAALEPHDEWGLGVVTPAGDGSGTPIETWREVLPSPDDPAVPNIVIADRDVLALRITAPLTTTPLDVRAWARGHDGRWHRLDIGRFASELPAADLLLLPPTVGGRPLATWPAGRYRIGLLDGASIRRLDLTIDRTAPANDAAFDPIGPAVVDDGRLWRETLTLGPYVVEDGVVHPLSASAGPPLSEAEAWLATDRVASDVRPRAVAIGVLLPPGPQGISGVLRRIEPDAAFGLLQLKATVRPHPAGARAIRVEFALDPPALFGPGLYELSMTWTTTAGQTSTTWYVQLRPGVADTTPALLRAARRYAVHAGSPALVLSGGGRREPAADRAPVRVFPFAPSIGCGTILIDQTPAVLGFAHEGPPPDRIEATVVGLDGQPVPVPLRIADAGVPGLTLVEPADDATFGPGTYQFRLDTTDGPVDLQVCLGTSPFGG